MAENQPSVVIVKDDEGVVHFTSPNSDLAKKYLKRDEEASDAPVDASASDDRDTNASSGGPRQRRSASRDSGDAVRGSSTTEPEPGS